MTRQPLQEFKDHSKFVVRTAFSPSGTFLASASYDRRILIYRSTCPSSSSSQRQREGGNGDDEEDDVEVRPLGTRYERVHEVQLHANPEAILFVRAPASPPAAPAAVATSTTAQTLAATSSAAAPDSRSRTWLAYTVRGDCHLYYLALPLDADVETDAHAPGSGPFGSDGGAADGKDGAEPQTVGSSDADGESSLVNDWTVLKFNTNANPLDTHVSYSLVSALKAVSSMLSRS